MAVTLESLRAELQLFAKQALRAELHVFRDNILNEMQKSMCVFAPASPTYALKERLTSQCQSNEHKTKEAVHQAAAIFNECMPEQPGWAVEIPALPRPLLETVAEHGAMEESERLLHLQGADHPKHRKVVHLHHGKSKIDSSLKDTAETELNAWMRFRRRMSDLVSSDNFDMFSGAMVMLNACYLGYQTDWVARHWTDNVPLWFTFGDVLFCIVTVFEVTVRMIALGPSFFYVEGCGWNWFDFLVGSTQVLDVSTSVMADLTGSTGNHKSMSSARILKLVRIFRIARIASVFPQLHVLISSIVDSLSSLFWTLVLIFAFLYGAAIALTQIVNDHKMVMGAEHMEVHEEEILALYGTLQQSMISLYMVISEGIHWGELCDPLAENISPWMKLVFVMFVGFMLFAMMNIITACFVDNAMKIAAKAESDECLTNLWQMMEETVGVGSHVTKDVFVSHFDQPGMAKFLELTDADGEDPDQIFGLIDESGDGKLDADEFVECCGRLMGGAKALQVKKDIFSLKEDIARQLHELKELQQKTSEQSSQQLSSQVLEAMESRLLVKIEGFAADAAAAAAAGAASAKQSEPPPGKSNKKWSPR